MADRLNLDLAWKRVKEDFKQESFYNYPFAERVIDSNLHGWLDLLKGKLQNEDYHPSSSETFDIPKKNWHIRPGGVLLLEDSVVYSALVYDALKPIYKELHWSAKKHRFSNILKSPADSQDWFEFNMRNWNKYTDTILKEAKNSKFVVQFDVSGFFENIEISRLISDLQDIGVSRDTTVLLSKCLRRWSKSGSRGLLQGFSPSQILAEVYLDTIDQQLDNINAKFVRYSDDGYIFTKSKQTAIEVLHMLTRFLRDKGLNLQTSKTGIKENYTLVEQLRVIPNIIETTQKGIRSEVNILAGFELNYLSPTKLRKFFNTVNVKVEIESLRQAFEINIRPYMESFDKTPFHFILHRLASARDDFALSFCLDLFTIRPEETRAVLEHLTTFMETHKKQILDKLVEVLSPKSILLDYQRYLILEWLLERDLCSQELLNVVRDNLNKPDLRVWVRDYILAYLGHFGNRADLETIKSYYNNENNKYSNTTVICALKRMHTNRRNAFYNQVLKDEFLIETAVNWVKSHST